MNLKFVFTFILVFTCATLTYSQQQSISNNDLITRYLNSNVYGKEKITKEIIKKKICFDTIYNRLKTGKQYSSDVQKGFYEHNFKNKVGIEHPNLVFIPFKYDPKKKYQVRLFLHGGVSTFDMRFVYSLVNRVDTSWQSVNKICLFPASYGFSKWWTYKQYENLTDLLNYIKATYNVDENNIYINGVSDGATGIYYLSNFFQTPFSCYLPYIGSMNILSFLDDKQFYIKNYQGLSFFIVNSRKDKTFDIDYVIPSVNELKKTAKDTRFFVSDTSEHNIGWYPALKDSISNFIKTHKRNPFPDIISYATEKPDTFNRKFWVIIDRIGKTEDKRVIDQNSITFNNLTVPLFPRKKPFGQIEVNKNGNDIMVITSNVKKYTLLISPDHFDLGKPVRVYTNNILSFEGAVPKEVSTLLKYNTIDNDRTMLFAYELTIHVGKRISK